MKFKVHHKGLIIVVTPLLIELLLIGSLAYLVVLTDQQQSQAATGRTLAILSARLVFSNIHAVNSLNGAGTKPEWRRAYEQEIAHTRDYLTILSSTQAGLDGESLFVSRRLVEVQGFVLSTLDRIMEINSEGPSLRNLYRLLAVEDRACKRLDEGQALVSQFNDSVSNAARKGQLYLQRLYQAGAGIVLLGVVLNLAAAFALMQFFQRNFLLPIAVIRDNVGRMEGKAQLHNPLSGADEICDVDRSFHEMNRQLILAAEKEKALFDNSSDIICILDDQLTIVRINRAAQAMLGYGPEMLAGNPLSRIVSSDCQERVLSELDHVRQSGMAGAFESEVDTAVGQTTTVLWSAIWAQNQRNWYCVLHDISEQKNIERAQRDLVRLIASDFEQPLLRISSQIELLASGQLGPLPEKFLGIVSKATGTVPRLVKLVRDLLQIEHLQSTDMTINHTTCNVIRIQEESCRDVEPAAQRKHISIVRQCDSSEWQIDQDKIIRVLVNLLSNAIKFAPEGSTIKLISRGEGDTVFTQVVDEGRGIPSSILESLFQPFQQVETADGERGKGSGLGLVICKRIVEQHGGEIGVDSEPERGSTFWFHIPMHKSVPRQEQPEQVEQAAGLPTAGPYISTQGRPAGSFLAQGAAPARVETLRSGKLLAFLHFAIRPLELVRLPESGATGSSSFWGGWNLRKKGWLLIAIPLVFELTFVAGMLGALLQGEEDLRRQIHDRELTAPAIKMVVSLAAIGYSVGSILRDSTAVHNCDQNLQLLAEAAQSFETIARQDSPATAVAQDILPSLDSLTPVVRRLTGLAQRGTMGMGQYLNSAVNILAITDGITRKLERLLNLLDARHRAAIDQQAHTRSLLLAILLAGLVINVGAALGLAIFFSKDVVRRLLALSDNSRRFAEHLPLNPPVPGSDEIAGLDLDFHATADRIAEQRARERAFLDQAHSIICALDPAGVFTASNPAAHQILGLSAEQLSTISFFDLLEEHESASVRKALEQAKQTKLPDQFETRVSAQDRRVDLLWSCSWSPTEDSYFCVAHDVTRRKNLDRLKKEFIAIISHDLRSPITTISGISSLLLQKAFGPQTPQVEAALKQMALESERIIELVNDILDLEKLEAGKLDMQTKPVDVNSLLTKSIEQVKTSNLPIELVCSAADAQLPADLDRLSHALAGLLNELLNCQPAAIAVVCNQDNNVLSLRLQASHCRVDSSALDSLVDSATGGSGSSFAGASSRMRMPLSRKVIEAHAGRLHATCTAQDVSVEIIFPASSSSRPDASPQQIG